MDIAVKGPVFGQSAVCEPILRALPGWFGIEKATRQYVQDTDVLPTFVAWVDGKVAGFLALKRHTEYAAEVHVMGVPATGNGLYQPTTGLPRGTWEQGVFDHKDLAANYVHKKGYVRYWDDEAKVPWLYNPDKEVFITYKAPQSIGFKADYVNAQDLGGVMFWELSTDDGSLLSTLYWRLRYGH